MSRTQVWSQMPRRYWQTHSFPAYAAAGMDWEAIAVTPDESRCLEALREACGAQEGPIERHSRRVFLLAVELAADREADRELLACAAWLHDIGLYETRRTKDPYVTDGRHVAERLLAGWAPER